MPGKSIARPPAFGENRRAVICAKLSGRISCRCDRSRCRPPPCSVPRSAGIGTAAGIRLPGGRRQASGRQPVRRLPRHQPAQDRLHARGLAHRDAHDAEHGSADPARIRWRRSPQYLIKSFPERPRPAANIIDGPVQVSIKQWPVPTPGSRPHDPRATSDGSIWYTGQTRRRPWPARSRHRPVQGVPAQDAAYRAARPRRGQGRQHLVHRQPHRHHRQARPEDRRGDRISDAGSGGERSAHAQLRSERHPVVHGSGRQHRRAGSTRRPARSSSSPRRRRTPRPYGLMINSKGIPVFVEFGTNKVATIDPQTCAIKEYPLPNPAARPRRLALTPDDVVWYTDFSRGYPRPARSCDRRGQGMAVAERPEVRALWHRLHQGRALVQRVRRKAEHDRALRPEDREVPELGDPRRRRHRAQHGRDPRRQSGHRQQPGQSSRAGGGEVGRIDGAASGRTPRPERG